MSCYIMKCEWLKNESNYFVTCKYFQLILQPLQTVANVTISSGRLPRALQQGWVPEPGRTASGV